MRVVPIVLFTLLFAVGVHSLPVFTNTTTQELSRSINKVDFQMMVITLKVPPGYAPLRFSLDTMYIITSSSVLFDTKPYMMYYTAMSTKYL